MSEGKRAGSGPAVGISYPRGAVSLAVFSVLLASSGAWAQGALPQSAAAKCDRAQFRVILDVGHSVEVPGARSARGVPEYEFNLRLAELIERNLRDAGFGNTVLLVTAGPARPSLIARVESANRSPAHLFLSIHHDSVPDRLLESWEHDGKQRGFSDRFKGHSIFISYENSDPSGSLLFARLLGSQLKSRGLHYTPHYTEPFMGYRQRELIDAKAGVYRYDQLIVLKDTRMPAVLLEAGLIINRDEELLLASPEHQARISAAVSEAVEKFCALRLPRKSGPMARRPPPAAPRREAAPLEPR
jgi:N-acetylmuramoyl-L-alanine amidase